MKVLLMLLMWCACAMPRQAAAQVSYMSDFGRMSHGSVRQYVADLAIPRQLSLPANIDVPEPHRSLIEHMLRRSPTFRRQCLRIAAAPKLSVRFHRSTRWWPSNIRARTHFARDSKGYLVATIEIATAQDWIELIAHEFEHIIEQLDGVDLAAHARRRTGVIDLGVNETMFETIRATHVGRRVSSEVED